MLSIMYHVLSIKHGNMGMGVWVCGDFMSPTIYIFLIIFYFIYYLFFFIFVIFNRYIFIFLLTFFFNFFIFSLFFVFFCFF